MIAVAYGPSPANVASSRRCEILCKQYCRQMGTRRGAPHWVYLPDEIKAPLIPQGERNGATPIRRKPSVGRNLPGQSSGAKYVFSAFAMAQPLKRFVFLATDGSLCVQGTQADAHGFSASICEICAICGQKKAKLTEGQRPKPYEFSGFTALNTYGAKPLMIGVAYDACPANVASSRRCEILSTSHIASRCGALAGHPIRFISLMK
jgi:hypothetical protein